MFPEHEHQVALSFAGEQREYVTAVARALSASGVNYFFADDEAQQVKLWGADQTEFFEKLFSHQAHVVVMFISKEYVEKAWPSHERRSALSAAVQKKSEYVLPARFDDAPVPGLPTSIAYVNAGPDGRSPEALAELIVAKLVHLGETVRPAAAPQADITVAQGGAPCEIAITITNTDGKPLAGAEIAIVTAVGIRTSGKTDDAGRLQLALATRRHVTVMVAHGGHRPGHRAGVDPGAGAAVTMHLPAAPPGGGGKIIDDTGYLPGVAGRLNPLLDSHGRLYLYASNMSINDSAKQPQHFQLNQAMQLEDQYGARMVVTIIDIVGRVSLISYELL